MVGVKHHGRVHHGGRFPVDRLAEAEKAAVDLRNRLFTNNRADR
jgi:hypothetical protein